MLQGRVEEIDSLFKYCDADGSGEITFEELKVILEGERNWGQCVRL